MPAKLRFLKLCEECKKEIPCKINRDRKRKRFCGRKCLGLWTIKHRDNDKIIRKMHLLCNTVESNKKKSHSGENHPFWIKDRSKVKFRPRFEGREWELAVFKRDSFTCQKCGYKGRELVAHHLKPYRLFSEFRFDILNGQTLCKECHKQTASYCAKLNKLTQIYAFS